jgi:class 3 adenylate cyclase
MTELPSGTVTLLFTDVDGSTELVKRLGERYAAALAEHRALLREAFGEHGGIEVDTQGDAFFVAFGRARDAVVAAVAAQRALAAHPWPNDAAVSVRIGLHTGEPYLAEQGYMGLAVHRAARICTIAQGGQVLLSHVTAGIVDDDQVSGVALRDLGDHRLKDFDRPERIFQLVIEGCETSSRRRRQSIGRAL